MSATELLGEHGVPGHMLCFETSETSAVVNLSAATTLAQRVKALGCRFALDNFGSGLSSFSYLKGMPLDFLKIDGRFVRDMLLDPMDRGVVESIHRIGRVIGLRYRPRRPFRRTAVDPHRARSETALTMRRRRPVRLTHVNGAG
jgi:EAL domain-containing protein (putative c-di-GMP-specific phosphodiesterase class I)